MESFLPYHFLSYFLLLFVGLNTLSEYKLDDGVIVLSKADFKKAINNIEFILVEFYAPWCGHCKQLAPEYSKAAKILAEEGSPVKLAKVDATEESELAEEYSVRGYPTLKFFKNGKPYEYGGGRQYDTIISWLKKKIGPPAVTITSIEDHETFVKNNTVSVVGYFKDPENKFAKLFLSVAAAIDDHPFAIVSDGNVMSESNILEDKVVLHKSFDEGKVEYSGDFNEDALKSFIFAHSLPLVVEFNHETATKIFNGDIKNHLLLFFSKKNGHFEKHLEDSKNIAKLFRGKVMFVTINTDEEDHVRILEFFGMKSDEIPAMRAIKLEDDMAKYKPESSELSADIIKAFVNDFVEGKLKQHYLSQKLPEDWDSKPVKVLVASNFDKIVMDDTKDVLVEFYAPWCGHCKQLAPIYDQLGEKFKDKQDVVIAKIDATANEIENIKISSFPTITLYPKDKSKVVEYNGERTLDSLIKFVESGGEYKKAEQEEKDTEDSGEDETPEVPKDEL